MNFIHTFPYYFDHIQSFFTPYYLSLNLFAHKRGCENQNKK
ncbi:hypothetical protein HMPREF6123_1541 [Oribacterium sinus F0268]|uniref:Uncharacterized protein n=1 Tax=Oribacterium sinus F0268 TaxID=585501 RepID=C2KYH2_9FIRM|nr:hypothetical protein HMPREF6123_1541 [Oribacterium sinus F0268]